MDIIILKSFVPEIFLSLAILGKLIFNTKVISNLKFNYPIVDKEVLVQTVFVLFCLLMLLFNVKIEGFMDNFIFLNDSASTTVKILIVLTTLALLKTISQSLFVQKINFFEFYIVFLLAFLASLLLISSYDLISFYITIEMQSLCFYILTTIKRDSVFSTEAGLKYFIAGSFISLFFLLGACLIYGVLGTLNLNHINLLLSLPLTNFNSELNSFLEIGIFFVTATLLFKVVSVPFHFWSPDVYEGAPLSSTIIFSIIPKLSIFFFFIKWICCIGDFYSSIQPILLISGILSVLVGTLFSISQKRLKRLLIYSSIAQVGFLVCALGLNTLGGFSVVYFFLIIYMLTSILMWGHFSVFSFFQSRISKFHYKLSNSLLLSSFSNLFRTNAIWSFSFVIMFFSIAGIPPFTGFLGKALVLFELIKEDNLLVAIILMVISSISVFYYIRIIKIMFFENKISLKKTQQDSFQTVFFTSDLGSLNLILAICLFLLIALFFSPNLLILLTQDIVLNSISF